MSASRPYFISDEDDDVVNSSESELELLDYDSEPEITEIASSASSATPTTANSKNDIARFRKLHAEDSIRAPDAEIQRYKLNKSSVIKPGDTVELRDHSAHESDLMHSGDFLRIKKIIINLETDEVRLRGHRLRRTKYLGQIFDWKLNELSMVLHVDEDDPRCPFLAGLEEVPVHEVLRPRECVLTNKSYPLLSFRDGPRCAFPTSMNPKEIKQQVFHGGRLTCRVVNIVIAHDNGKPYSGIIRHLYGRESDAISAPSPNGLSRPASIPMTSEVADSAIVGYGLSGLGKKRDRSNSVEEIEGKPHKRKSPMPFKHDRYTLADVFCGAGGASQGAKQAGLHVTWGLDNDEEAIRAYQLNHPGALPFMRNAHNFPPRGFAKEDLRVCILHLSPPCCYFSPAHTTDGPNDQANLEAIYTVGPILKRVKPRVATLEQTFGLSTQSKHKANFYLLLYDVGKAGYDIRYKIQNLSEFGLAQPRKRLLIIAASRGTPLPPFPKPTHGATGSGLKHFNTIKDALLPIQRLGNRATDDPYHQPKPAACPREPYNPDSFLKGCITTKGSDAYHYSGTRKYTPRELALFQSFPMTYQFSGSKTEANKQIGNAFPPIMAEALYRTIAKTLEAFDNGFIDAEDDLTDLDEILKQKGVNIPHAPMTRSAFDGPPRPTNLPYRYLVRDDNDNNGRPSALGSSPFARQNAGRARPRSRTAGAFEPMDFQDGLLDGFEFEEADDLRDSIESESRLARGGRAIDDAIEVSSESEDESESDSE